MKMKMKTTKRCALKGCGKEFKMYRTTDKYCSPGCAYEAEKAKPKKEKKLYQIKPQSEKLKRETLIYRKKRKTFMEKPENFYCPVCIAAFNNIININELENKEEIIRRNGFVETTDVHHKAGRKGKLLNYVPYWMAVSRKGHDWIHDNPKQAYELGFLIRPSTVNI